MGMAPKTLANRAPLSPLHWHPNFLRDCEIFPKLRVKLQSRQEGGVELV